MSTSVGDRADDRFALWDGAYVLGALSDDERREFEAHLSGCASCRAAVAELSGIPPLLSLLDPAEVTALDENRAEPPPAESDVVRSLVGAVSRRRRRRRIAVAVVGSVAAAVLAVGVLILARPGTVGLHREAPPVAEVAMDQVVPSPVQATVALTDAAWGTQIDMTCTYGSWADRSKEGGELAMVLVGRDGRQTQAATWMAKPGASVTLAAGTSLPVDQIASVQVVSTETNQVLLQRNL